MALERVGAEECEETEVTKDDFQLAFPDCTDIAVLKVVSGQKDVAKANCNGKTVALKVFKKSGGDEDKRI